MADVVPSAVVGERSTGIQGALRPILLLMSGSAFAQLIALLLAPVLTRLYSAPDFGALALALSLVAILSLFGSGTYDASVNLPPDRSRGFALFVAASGGGLLMGGLLVVASGLEWWWTDDWSHRLWFVPAATVLTVTFNASSAWANRERRFHVITRARVYLTLVNAFAATALGLAGWGERGLLISNLLGLFAGGFVFARSFWAHDRDLIRTTGRVAVFAEMRTQRRFPLWQLPAACVDSAAVQMPVWFLQSLFGAGVVGQYALMNRVLIVPLTLFGSSFGEVFRQRAAEEWHEHGHCRTSFRSFGRLLALAAIAPTAVLLFAGPAIFELVFGEDWRAAGEFAQVTAALFALRFVVSPLTYVILLAGRQRLNLLIQALFLGGALLAWWYGAKTGSPHTALAVYAGAHAAVYGVFFWACWRFGGSR